MLLSNLKGNFAASGAGGQAFTANDGHSSLSSTPDNDVGNDSVSAFSDDSGISSSSSPVNGQSSNTPPRPTPRYVRSNTVQNAISASTTPSASMMSLTLSRTLSTPQMYAPAKRFNINPGRKGIMQRFIATRGKIAAANAAAAAANNGANGDDRDATDFAGRKNDSILVSHRRRGSRDFNHSLAPVPDIDRAESVANISDVHRNVGADQNRARRTRTAGPSRLRPRRGENPEGAARPEDARERVEADAKNERLAALAVGSAGRGQQFRGVSASSRRRLPFITLTQMIFVSLPSDMIRPVTATTTSRSSRPESCAQPNRSANCVKH